MSDAFETKKNEHLSLVLKAIRTVGRLLVTENDPGTIIQGICRILVKHRGYYNAWIGLVDKKGNVIKVADAGFDERFQKMRDNLKKKEFTLCVKHTLVSESVYVAKDPVTECKNCILAPEYGGRGALAVRLSYEEKNFGFMVLSIPKELATDALEKSIVKEIADDIAFGLYRHELEEKQKAAKNAEKKGQIRFKTLIENSLNCISIIRDHQIVYKNSGLRKVHILMKEAFEPPDFLNIYEDDRDKIIGQYNQLVSNKIDHIETDFRYYPIKKSHHESEIRWALLSATKIDYLGNESILTNAMDITDSREVEGFLKIQDKMTSLGRVTAGIAHEIRNPLSGIYIYLKALKKIYNQMGDINQVVSIIDKIELASKKIESIIKRVMDFSKPGMPSFVMTNLNQYIEDVTKLTAVSLRKSGIKFVKDLDPELTECFAEPHLIEQVVLNLITNAAEAMKDYTGEKIIELRTFRQKDSFTILVKDSGPGIPISRQTKIFDPFYTTKTNSSGIGLSICHRIIQDHQGSLKYSASKTGGAEFIIELPLKSRDEIK
ncbi:MAG: GHKL domain-containing protein [Desulfobacteraceae bacterium]|nr:GHKL domain-containing protein [Desulfobacteraceae bacterium]